jgi:hypothetical protein
MDAFSFEITQLRYVFIRIFRSWVNAITNIIRGYYKQLEGAMTLDSLHRCREPPAESRPFKSE